MKNFISLFIIMLSINMINAQDRVEITDFKIKTKRVFNYKTDYKSYYHKRLIYYLSGKKYDGIIFENWENGSLKQEFEVKNGIQEGFNRTFYANGKVEYNYPEGKLEAGEHIIGYHENGNIKYIHIVLSTEKEGHRLVTNKMYNDKGRIIEENSYKDGMPHGIRYIYDEKTGDLRLQTSFENGEKHGLEIYYPLWGETKRAKWINGKPIIPVY